MNIPHLPAGLPDWALPAGVALVAALAGIGYLAGNRARRRERPDDASPSATGAADVRALRRWRAASMLLTVAAAGVATAMSLNGMWQVFGDALHLDGPGRVALVGFLEIALLGSAIRARLALIETGRVGADGAAVWVLAIVSAGLSAADATGLARPLRFVPPLLAAWMWERGLAADRRHAARSDGPVAGWQPIAWRWTPRNLAVRLHLADPTHRTGSDVDRARRLAALTRARLRLAVLEADDVPAPVRFLTGRPVRVAYRTWRLQRHALAAVEHLRLGTDPTVPATIATTVAAVVGLRAATKPAALVSASPWTPTGSPDLSIGSTPAPGAISEPDRHPIPTVDPITDPDRIHPGMPAVNGSDPGGTDGEHTPDRIVTTQTRPHPGSASRPARPQDLTRVREAIATGQLAAEPTADAIRRHLGISPAYARAARDAITPSVTGTAARLNGAATADHRQKTAAAAQQKAEKTSPASDPSRSEPVSLEYLNNKAPGIPQGHGTHAVALP